MRNYLFKFSFRFIYNITNYEEAPYVFASVMKKIIKKEVQNRIDFNAEQSNVSKLAVRKYLRKVQRQMIRQARTAEGPTKFMVTARIVQELDGNFYLKGKVDDVYED